MSSFDFAITVSTREYNEDGALVGDTTVAVKAIPEMTIQELVNKHLREHSPYEWIPGNPIWPSDRKHITIRAEVKA